MTKVYLTQVGAFTAIHSHGGTLSEGPHSHRFQYEVTFFGPLNDEGYLLDFRILQETFYQEFDSRLEGTNLSEFIPLPTTEALAVWIYKRVTQLFPSVYSVKVAEEPDRWITYKGDE